MNFKCPLLDDYFFELSMFGFLYKIDYEHDSFTSASKRCATINEVNKDIEE